MAIVRKGNGSGSGLSVSPSTSAFDCTDANCIVVWVSIILRISQTITSVTDSKGNTYTQITAPVGGLSYGTFYIATGITTANNLVVTANISGINSSNSVHAVGYSNIDQTTPDKYVGSDITDPCEVIITPDDAGDALIMGYAYRSATSVAVGTDQVKIGSEETPPQALSGFTEELAAGTSADTQSSTAVGESVSLGMAFALIIDAGGGGAAKRIMVIS